MSIPDENRLTALSSLSKRVQDQVAALDALKQDKLRKWLWNPEALSIIEQLRALATSSLPLVRSRLDKALEFPSAEWADPTLFMGGKPGFEQFYRTEKWFEEMGFIVRSTPYTFSDTWDCTPINATFLVPKDLDTKGTKKVKIVFFFHGGGFCTGAGDFVSWYSQSSFEFSKANNAIIIAPDYPLGPEASYLDISNAVKSFLIWYCEGGCFEPGFTHWRDWLTSATGINLVDLTPANNHILIEGESAGGHAAVTAMFANAEKKKLGSANPWACGLPILAVLLRYPMIKHYARECSELVSYMNLRFTKAGVERRAQDIKDAIAELEDLKLVPSRSRSYPPQGMSAAFLLSITKEWQGMFQRHSNMGDDIDATMDCLERAQAYAGYVEEGLPAIVVYHGDKDSNCPVSDTRKFCDLLLKYYPDQYMEGDTLVFDSVSKLEAQPMWNDETQQIEEEPVETVTHGFDYNLSTSKEKFLQKAFKEIGKHW